MNDLLKLAVEAHGGLTRWNRLAAVEARLSISGALWHLKGKPDALKDIRIEAPLHREWLITHFATDNRRATFSPDRIVIETESGDFLESRENPRTAFQGHTLETPWDDFHRLYFNSYALWNYLMAPFLYTWPGFETEELAPWEENGEVWRPLKITYPDSIAGHTREQVAYYGQDGLLRRHAYTVDVLGGASGLNYAYDYRNVNGIMVPTTRRVYPSDANKQKVPEPLLVAIDIRDIAFIEAQQAQSARPLPPIVRIVLTQAARHLMRGQITTVEFKAQIERLSREELEPRGLSVLVRDLCGETTRFIIKTTATGQAWDMIDIGPDGVPADERPANLHSSEPVFLDPLS